MYNVIHASFCSVQSANDSFDLRFEMKGVVRERLGVLKCQCLKLFFQKWRVDIKVKHICHKLLWKYDEKHESDIFSFR